MSQMEILPSSSSVGLSSSLIVAASSSTNTTTTKMSKAAKIAAASTVSSSKSSAAHPTSGTSSGKASRLKLPKKPKEEPSLRFEVTLDKNKFNHVSFVELVRRANSAKKEKSKPKDPVNPDLKDDPFGDEDEDEVAKIAARLEAKYGRGSTYDADGYIDRGEGYDENDSFIDNAEAYDELIPASLTTELGGFYINTGELKFKPVDKESGDSKQNGKSIEDMEREAEYEKASVLQKLKRKRNRIEDDSDSGEPPIVKPGRKPKGSKVKETKLLKPMVENTPTPPTAKQYKRQSSNLSDQSMLLDLPASLVSVKRKNATSSSVTPLTIPTSPSIYSMINPNKPNTPTNLTDPSSIATNAASLAHNLINNTIHQLINQNITDSLLNNSLSSSSNGMNGTSTNAISANQGLILLRQNLLSAKVPYDIINSLPVTKPSIQPEGKVLPFDWNRYLVDVYKKTSNAQKIRTKIFDYISAYIQVPRDNLLQYTHKIIIDPVEVRKYQKPGSGGGANSAGSSPTHSTGVSSVTSMAAPSSTGSTVSSKKASSVANSSGGAINLSTNQSSSASSATSYSEGLASKLILSSTAGPVEVASPAAIVSSSAAASSQQRSSSKSSTQSSGKSSSAKPTAAQLAAAADATTLAQFTQAHSNLSNFAMLQSLANLASSTSPLSLSGRAGGVATSNNIQAAHQSSQPSVASLQSALHPGRAGTPPGLGPLGRASAAVRSSSPSPGLSSANPNSLLLNSTKTSPNNHQIPATSGSPVGGAVSSSNSPQRQNDILQSLFHQLPTLFSNTDLINRFLSTSQAPTSGSGSSSIRRNLGSQVNSVSSTPSAVVTSATSNTPLNSSLLLNHTHQGSSSRASSISSSSLQFVPTSTHARHPSISSSSQSSQNNPLNISSLLSNNHTGGSKK